MSGQRAAAAALWLSTGIGCAALVHAGPWGAVPGALWGSITLYSVVSSLPRLPLELARLLDAGRWAAVALLAPLATKLDTSPLENQNRLAILEHISEHPGASIQEVRDAVGVAWGTAVYHLERLRREEKVVSHRSGNHRRFWTSGTPEAGMRRGWAVLEQPTARDIAMAVAATPGMHQGAICEALQVRAPSASKHLTRLEQSGLVVKQRVSRYAVYAPTERLEQILTLRSDERATAPTARAFKLSSDADA